MLAASFGLIYEGVNHGLFRTLAGALEEASENLIAVMITLSVVAMVAFQVLIR
jgi:hypothetical protein